MLMKTANDVWANCRSNRLVYHYYTSNQYKWHGNECRKTIHLVISSLSTHIMLNLFIFSIALDAIYQFHTI